MSDLDTQKGEFLFYASEDGTTSIQVLADKETVWASQKGLSEIFEKDISGISRHIKNIYDTGELDKSNTLQKMQTANSLKPVDFYSLDMIISVGYRVNSYKATQFRIWATKVLNEYLRKGFAMDDERLRQGGTLFGKDYFDELLKRIRDIRASEKRLYLKVTKIYEQCSYDYDKNSPITRNFFGNVQNKLFFAIAGKTAAEIKKARADYSLPNMGLNTWANQKKGGGITKTDVEIAKNYLQEEEIDGLNRLVNMFLDYAENLANKQKKMSMKDWSSKLDSFLAFNEYEVLSDYGNVSTATASEWAIDQYKKFKPIQNLVLKSDFENVVHTIKSTGSIPSRANKKTEKEVSEFDKSLKQALNYNPKA